MTDKLNKKNSNKEETIQIPLAELIKIRQEKVVELKKKDISAYPYRFSRSHHIQEGLDNFDKMAADETNISIAGRIMLKRKMGKSFFADLQDSSNKIQIYIKHDIVGKENFELFNTFDLGDIIGCQGTLFVTKTGEKTLRVSALELLTKALHPLPDKHSGLTDKEMRYRRRYADLIVNPEVRQVFIQRTKIIQAIRDSLNSNGFLEVETPILQPIYGGGMAHPFKTHYKRLNRDMYLRIADELYLKRLIIGGYDKVWELCKDFRNEGMDRLHNPEFSMIELYWAFADYKDIAELFENLLRDLVFKVFGKYKIKYSEHEIDFETPFKWITMLDSINEKIGIDFSGLSFEDSKKAAGKILSETDEYINRGKLIEAVWEATVEPHLIQPTFIADFPIEISPLAKRHRSNPELAERFELFIAGQEMGNAFSELNDPVEQLKRFWQQGKAIEAGDEEAQPLDDDFITALSYGMPPTGGLGFGVDRLVMLLTNQHSIRDVLFFPQMKELGDGSVPVSKIIKNNIFDKNKKKG